ncbi:MAG TPA: hypothetical protein VHU23_06090 [Rhizomicrobium sp.]|jgi:hypothetical protein|nr:hypothetical protein [Rhizomicrobium sp.]
MPHPLQGAFDRVDRANEHIAEFETEQTAFGRAYHDNLSIEPNSKPPPDFCTREKFQVIPSDRSAILLGEITYNFRAALDYLVFELAWKDSGSPQDFTQFPICDLKKDFDRKAPRDMVGISAAHQAAIERLQPYNRCNWTAVLRDISNPDKHRHLVRSDYGFRIRITTLPAPDLKGINAPMFRSECRAERPSGEKVNVYLATEAPIMIRARMPGGNIKIVPVIELLKQIEAGVRDTLEAFKPEF